MLLDLNASVPLEWNVILNFSSQMRSTGVRAKSAIMKLAFVESLDLLVAGCEDGNICKCSLFKMDNYIELLELLYLV